MSAGIRNYMYEDIQLASYLAHNLHNGQKYGDEDYFSGHIDKVVASVSQYCYCTVPEQSTSVDDWSYVNKLLICAYLHDALEDTWIDEYQLEKLFGSEVVQILVLLWHFKRLMSYDIYINLLAESREASIIKFADALTNYNKCIECGDEKRSKKYYNVMEKLGNKWGFDIDSFKL